MRFVLEIELGNAAMRNGNHVAAALREAADVVAQNAAFAERDACTVGIRDENGNTVGSWAVEA